MPQENLLMLFRTLALAILVFSSAAFAAGRSPAVEDFVGIEMEERQVVPQGTESLFNLEQDIQRLENRPEQKKPTVSEFLKTPYGPGAVVGIILALGLPLSLWFLVMSHFKRKASLESASNIEVLEKYRQEREKKRDERIKRVS